MTLRKAEDFIRAIEAAENQDTLKERTAAFIRDLGFDYFACVSHVDRENIPPDAVDLQNYPGEWVERFAKQHLEKIDPVQRYARLSFVPFSWDDPQFLKTLTADQLSILEDARAFGICYGFTVPIHAPRQVSASFSVTSADPTPRPASQAAIQVIAPFIYNRMLYFIQGQPRKTTDQSRLTARQTERLELAALGKSDWVIGEILGISERTVHHHLEGAKKRLGVATRAQAIVEALRDAQISMSDIQAKRTENDR